MKVNNVNGTAGYSCKCGSWLAHWKKFSGQPLPDYCVQKTCRKKPEVGAHVQKDSAIDKDWYIIPLCTDHNQETGGSLIILDGTVLVPASVSRTCGRG
jgi:hypothetical protein